MFCQIKYTPEPKAWAYQEAVRRQALQMYVDGMNLRRITRHLGLHHRTVSMRVKAQADRLPDPPVHIEVLKNDQFEFGAYDNFLPTLCGPAVARQFLDGLLQAGVLTTIREF